MVVEDPSQFYTGLVAQLYAPLRSAHPDPAVYTRFVRRSGEPALELGCGDGDPLLDLRVAGLDVEGLDSSADMLERARSRAAELGVDVVLHHADMTDFDLGRTFRTIYLAGPTFNLLSTDADALAALVCIRRHLAADGRALIPLFIPQPVDVDAAAPQALVRDDGSTISCRVLDADRDDDARTQITRLRYVREDRTGREELTRSWLLHWYTPAGFTDLAAGAGLRILRCTDRSGRPVEDSSAEFVMQLVAESDGAAVEQHRVAE